MIHLSKVLFGTFVLLAFLPLMATENTTELHVVKLIAIDSSGGPNQFRFRGEFQVIDGKIVNFDCNKGSQDQSRLFSKTSSFEIPMIYDQCLEAAAIASALPPGQNMILRVLPEKLEIISDLGPERVRELVGYHMLLAVANWDIEQKRMSPGKLSALEELFKDIIELNNSISH